MRLLFLALFVFVSVACLAQSNTPVLWSTKVDTGIQWTYLSGETLIVAKNDTTVSGIDLVTGNVKWTFKPIAGSITSGVIEISKLPYLQLRGTPLTIIDPADGRLIVDGGAEHIANVYNYGFLYESGHLWLDAEIDFGRGLSLFDLSTGKKLWTRYDYFGLPNKTDITVAKGTVVLGSKGGTRQRLLCAPINNSKDYMVFVTGDKVYYNDLYKVLIRNGDVVWRLPAPDPAKDQLMKLEPDTTFFRLIEGPDNFYYVRPKWTTACSYNNGKAIWRNPVKANSKIGEVIHDKRGTIFCSTSADADSPYSTGYFRLVNDTTGLELWKEPLDIVGGVSKYEYTAKGLAVVTENPALQLTPEMAGSNLNFIDVATGTYKLQDPLHIPGKIRSLQAVPKGVYCSTDRTLNIVDFEGKQFLDIPSHGIVQTEDSTRAWFYHDQDLYEIDKTTAIKQLLNKEKINFQRNDSPHHIEIRKDGVILYSNQNVAFINLDGSTRYMVHYRSIPNEFESATLESLRKAAPPRGLVLPHSSNTAFVVFIKNANQTSLSILSKDTGKIISKIDLPNEDLPTYHIDARTGNLFLVLKVSDSIQAYPTH